MALTESIEYDKIEIIGQFKHVQVYANENNTWIRVYDLNASGRRVDTCAKFLGANSVININFSYLAA